MSARAGIGLRQPHYEALMREAPPLGFIEVHSENFFADGGAALAVLHAARERYDVSLHGVGLALGSAAGVDAWHLDRLERLVQRIDPVHVSDHACFARVERGGVTMHAADLLPLGFNDESLEILCRNVAQVQERLRRPLLIENLSSYVSFIDDTMDEPAFFAALCRRSGCSMLLDVNNLVVNAMNRGEADPVMGACRFIDALPTGLVGEIHLAGFNDGGSLVIDDHGSRVRASVWAVYEHALARVGAVPTLVEWDTDLPAFDVLLGEAEAATVRMQCAILRA